MEFTSKTSWLLSRYIVVSDSFYAQDIGANLRLIWSSRSQITLIVPELVWTQISEGQSNLLSAETHERLVESRILVQADENELQSVLTVSRNEISSPTALYECLQPTAMCQLGCGYCGQLHQPTLLSEENQKLVYDRICSRLALFKYKHLRIGWFGGEPLLGLSVIRTLTPMLQAAVKNLNIGYSAHIVTNGMKLSGEVATELAVQHGVDKFEITLDGPAATHDLRRHTKAGNPTYQRIHYNLVAVCALALPVAIVVRCNVDRHNAPLIPGLIESLAEAGLQSSISLYFAAIHDWGNGADAASLTPERFAHLEIDWFALMASRGFAVPLMPSPKPVVCMAVDPHSELIDPFGAIYNCTEVPLVPLYGNPNRYALGTLRQIGHSEPANLLSEFVNEIDRGNVPCSRCQMLPVCGGACPKQWLDGKSPCPSAKVNMSERLLLAYALEHRAAVMA